MAEPATCEILGRVPDLEAGATGAMTGGAYPDGIRKIMDAWAERRREDAIAEYTRWLPLINYENRQGGIIASEAPRPPLSRHAP